MRKFKDIFNFKKKNMIEKISQKTFDELQELLNVTVKEDDYCRWIKNGEIRVCDIWDVMTDVPNMAIIDWKADEDEISELILKILEVSGIKTAGLDINVNYTELQGWIKNFNHKTNDIKIVIFGGKWGESDTVQLFSMQCKDFQKVKNNPELRELFSEI